MAEYVTRADRCRQQLLLAYFDEPDAPPCGVCDVCLAAKKARQPPPDTTALRQALLTQVQAEPLLPRDLVARYPAAEAATVTAALRELLDEGQLRYEASGQLRRA